MWFKNLYLLRINQELDLSAEELHEALEGKPFLGCGNEAREASGWVSPFGRKSEQLVLAGNGTFLVTLAHQEKMLPASVVKEELDAVVAEIEEKEHRKIGKREKQDLRDEIEFELLPKAFTRTKKLDAWIDQKNGWMVINTSSSTQGERLTHLLRNTLGSLPVSPPKVDKSPSQLLTQWLADETSLPAPFTLGEECELRGQGDEKSVAVFKRHELTNEEVQTNLTAGKLVSKLALIWADKISFILTDELAIRRVRFLDVLEENIKDADPQSQAEKLDIEFNLMTGEVTQMLSDLIQCFMHEEQPQKTIELPKAENSEKPLEGSTPVAEQPEESNQANNEEDTPPFIVDELKPVVKQ